MSRRRMTATPAENGARRLFREHGYRVEAVPFIRAHGDEFMAVLCWPSTDVGDVIELLTRPEQKYLDVQRIHVGRPYAGQLPECRVYLKWALPEPGTPR